MPGEHDGHRQRLKEQFVKSGIDAFPPHVVLELLTFYSVPRKDTNPLGHKLIERFGSISAVMDANVEDLMTVEGVTFNTAVLLTMIPQLARRYLEEKSEMAKVVGTCEDLGPQIMTKFVGRTVETVMLVSMDNKNKVISCNVIAEGGIDWAHVSKRKVMEEVVRSGATKVILAHNHPMGYAYPSNDDVVMTVEIKKLLNSIGVELVDHLIVVDDDYVSMKESGLGF